MRAFLVHGRQPKSVNAERTEPWKRFVRAEYQQSLRRAASALVGDLYALIYYFHRVAAPLDADNLSKPVLDALRVLAYHDDGQVKARTAGVFDLRGPIGVLELDRIRQPTQQHLTGLLASTERHTLYVEIGRLAYRDHFRFGLERET